MPWLTPRNALRYASQAKLSKLANEASERYDVGTGNGTTQNFTTGFFGGTVAGYSVYLGGVLQSTGFTWNLGAGTPEERDVLQFTTAPGSGVAVEVISKDAINADVLDDALLRAQAKIRGRIDAAMFSTPADDAASVPKILEAWGWDLAAWILASDVRRPGLLEVYPEIQARYDAAIEELDKVEKGGFSLRGICSPRDLTTADVEESDFISNDREFGAISGTSYRKGIL